MNRRPAPLVAASKFLATTLAIVGAVTLLGLLTARCSLNAVKSQVSEGQFEPVYNAIIFPQLPRDQSMPARPVLQAGQLTILSFGIGRILAGSVLPPIAPSQEILLSEENLPLTVVLACGFCEPNSESLKRMTYIPNASRSDEIRFQFTPRRRPDGHTYVDTLQLGIVNDSTGREYDRLVIDVAISGTTQTAEPTAKTSLIAFDPARDSVDNDWFPDVILYATAEMGHDISLAFQPISAEMKSRLSLAIDAEGNRRKFRSGIDDANLIEAMTTSAYGVMSAVSMQGQFLKRLSATGIDAAVSPESRQSLRLSKEESTNVTNTIAEIGQRLYRRLFVDAHDADLLALIVELEDAAASRPDDRPLRLKIVTNNVSVPWQYLHRVGPVVNAQEFWGLRFSLSVLRFNTGSRAKPAAQSQAARQVVFARYGSTSDPTHELAQEQIEQIRMLPVEKSNFLEVDNGRDLLATVEQRRKQISAIFAFLHATSISPDAEPHLTFNDGDIVTSDGFERLLNRVPLGEQDPRFHYLASAPLVVLNACETGPSVYLPHVALENVMFQLGARGVLVTEVSVWTQLGHEVGTQLIKRLGEGEPISDALTAIRRELYAEKANPLGLLYVYYGDPAATLQY